MDLPFSISFQDLQDKALTRLNRLFSVICSQIQPSQSSGVFPAPIATVATANLSLTTSYQSIVGMEIQLTKAGWWKIEVTAEISAAQSNFQNVILVANGIILPGLLQTTGSVAGGMGLTATRSWIFQSQTGSEVIQAQAKATGGSGNAIVGNAFPAQQVTQMIAVFEAGS